MKGDILRRQGTMAVTMLIALGTAPSRQAAGAERPVTWAVGVRAFDYPCALSPDGTMFVGMNVIATPLGGTIAAWDARTGRGLWSVPAGSDSLPSSSSEAPIVFSPNQKWLAHPKTTFMSGSSVIVLHETTRGAVIRELRVPVPRARMANGLGPNAAGTDPPEFQFLLPSPDGSLLVATDKHVPNTIHMWNTETGRHLGAFRAPSENVIPVRFSSNGQLLVGTGWTEEKVRVDSSPTGWGTTVTHTVVYVWNIKSGQQDVSFKIGYSQASLNALPVLSPDMTRIAYGENVRPPSTDAQALGQQVGVRNVSTGREERSLPIDVNELQFSGDGKTLFGVSLGSPFMTAKELRVKVVNLETGEIRETVRQPVTGTRPYLLHATLSSDGEVVAVATPHHVVRLVETRTGKQRAQLEGPRRGFRCYHAATLGEPLPDRQMPPLIFSRDGSRLISFALYGAKDRSGEAIVTNGSLRVTSWNLAASRER